jgi:hypothetical protein
MGTMDIMEVMVIKAATTLLTFLILTFQNIIIPMEVMPFHFMVELLSLSTLVIRTLLIITDTTDITNMVHFQKDILLTLIFMGFKTMDLMSIIAIWMLSLLVTSWVQHVILLDYAVMQRNQDSKLFLDLISQVLLFMENKMLDLKLELMDKILLSQDSM